MSPGGVAEITTVGSVTGKPRRIDGHPAGVQLLTEKAHFGALTGKPVKQ
jgi:hypothetical protein